MAPSRSRHSNEFWSSISGVIKRNSTIKSIEIVTSHETEDELSVSAATSRVFRAPFLSTRRFLYLRTYLRTGLRRRITLRHSTCCCSVVATTQGTEQLTMLVTTPRSLTTGLLTLSLLVGSIHGWSQACSSSSRREFFVRGLAGALVVAAPHAAVAAAPPTPQELEKLQKGHARVRYLLDHWDEVTQVCGTTIMSDTERRQVVRTEGGGGTTGCSKTPLRVQEFMGFKSTEDPLYKADKLMVRATPLVDGDDLDGYLDAVEKYKEKADNTALMAYTSSWGEANPNGSKEVIEDYLERTKADVVESEKSLRSVLKFLKLDTLPPIQGKL